MLVAISGVPASKNLTTGCEIAAEIGTTIFRKSYLEKGTITDSYLAEAIKAIIAYLDTVISPKKVTKAKIEPGKGRAKARIDTNGRQTGLPPKSKLSG